MSLVRYDAAKIVELYPQIGSTALFLKHVRDDRALAATDGVHVYLSEQFFDLEQKHRRGVLKHEYLHSALSHPERAGLMHMKEGKAFSMRRFNAAADALINTTIERNARAGQRSRHIGLPDLGLIYFDPMVAALKALGFKTDHLSLGTSTVEQLYLLLGKAEVAARDELARQPDEGSPSGQTADDIKARQKQRETRAAAQKILDWCEQDADLQPASGTAEEMRDTIRRNTEKLKNSRALHGNAAGDMFEYLSGDIPVSKTAWEKQFRYLAARFLGRERKKVHSRPANSVLSQRAMGSRVVWEPGRRREPAPRVLVIGDSSGSIMLADYAKFLGEVDRMRKRTAAIVDFTTADTRIGTITAISDATKLAEIKFDGRGGTSFVQPLQYAEEQGYDLVVYMTDLAGSFPKKCSVPVIWAVLEGATEQAKPSVPFGRVIEI